MNNDHSTALLSHGHVHLWTLQPALVSDSQRLALQQLLSVDEQHRVQRYKQRSAQHTALLTRALVRSVLSHYLALPANSFIFEKNKHGKPFLANNDAPIRFNLSHNDHMIVCAVCLDDEIGCDIENQSRKISIDGISRRFFSDAEHQNLNTLPEHTKRQQFFQIWTLKEAFVKCTGYGISLGLDTFAYQLGLQNQQHNHQLINLSIAKQCKVQNQQDFYHAMLFPDPQHCLALCIHNQQHKDYQLANIHCFTAGNLAQFQSC